ncbi:MAG TPA: hypothetical protein VN436_14035, partial [Holophaga sp.]|nr:hypothetical protein [Holophaga sp.]
MSWTSDTASDFTDLLVRLDSFLVDHGHSLPPAYTGTGTGRVSQVLGTTTTVQETITVQFTDATNYSVSGSVTGSMGTGTIGTAFTHARLGFLVSSGDTAWAAGDTISWVMTPPWARCRLRGGAAHLASTNFDITKVVDGSTGTYTNPLATDLPQWGGIKLIAALEVRSIRLTIHATPGNGPRDYAVEYSDDPGSGWTVASSWTAQTWSTAYQTRVHDVTACGVHRYWRLRITAANGTNVDLSELTFYTATGGQTLDALNWYGDGIWRAPGNAGVDQIYVGARLIWNEVGACWTWKLGGFAGYVAGNSFEAQPGGYSRAWLSLWNASIPYWFQADGKAVKIVAKVTSQY